MEKEDTKFEVWRLLRVGEFQVLRFLRHTRLKKQYSVSLASETPPALFLNWIKTHQMWANVHPDLIVGSCLPCYIHGPRGAARTHSTLTHTIEKEKPPRTSLFQNSQYERLPCIFFF